MTGSPTWVEICNHICNHICNRIGNHICNRIWWMDDGITNVSRDRDRE